MRVNIDPRHVLTHAPSKITVTDLDTHIIVAKLSQHLSWRLRPVVDNLNGIFEPDALAAL